MADIRHTLIIETAPQQVYKALTTAEGLSAWWTPNTIAIPETGTVSSFPFGDGYSKQMEVKELIPDEFVRWICLKGDKEWVGTSLTFKLIHQDETSLNANHPEVRGQLEQANASVKTLLLFEQRDWKEYSPTFAECSYTWAMFLRSLKLYCETGKGTPWPTQHGIT
ncbi:MAG: SRPBCC domain-containing protein [Chitinophagaceae bacterium]|nr:MAG: SRPBCC domain-containing protein [Chitinophagaceae bacterium]